jgi:hypothetical protein
MKTLNKDVKVTCKKCGKGFWLDRMTYESAKDLWDATTPWCGECNLKRIQQSWKENN